MAPNRPDVLARERAVQIDYTNHEGRRDVRTIIPFYVWFGTSEHHRDSGPQWLLQAWCLDRDARRDFALSGIHAWTDRPLPPLTRKDHEDGAH